MDASLQWVSGVGVLLLAVSLAVVGLTWTTKWRAAVSVALLLQAALLAHIEQALYLLPASSYASPPFPRTRHDTTIDQRHDRSVGWIPHMHTNTHAMLHGNCWAHRGGRVITAMQTRIRATWWA